MNTKKIGILLIAVGIIAGTATLLHIRSMQESGLALATEAEVIGGAILGANTPPATSSKTSLPVTLSIPKLEVNAPVEHLGLTKSGNMAAPDNFTNVSWYKFGTVPGDIGSAVMAGHDNGIYVRGVFRRLGELKVGDDVYVTAKDGEKLHFKVIETAIYAYDKAPLQKIFNRKDGKYLVLITCTGEWIPEKKMSDHRIVVYTELVE